MIVLVTRVAPVVAGLSLLAPESLATPVVWSVEAGGNGHAYEFVRLEHTVSWEEANAVAEAMTLENGDVGYLATVNYDSEQIFIQSSVLPAVSGHKNQVWLGGRQDPEGESSSPSDGWRWIVNTEVVPESWSYTNWLSENEPSNDGDIDERFLTMWVHYFQAGQDLRGKWNDEKSVSPDTAWIIGMIVEFSVPEPATAALSALGIALLALRFRRS